MVLGGRMFGLTDDQLTALVFVVGILILGFSIIPLDRYLDRRRERRDARRRNQAHPWRR